MIGSIAEAEMLSRRHGIPTEEILLMGLNLCGVNYLVGFNGMKRGRFAMKPSGMDRSFFFAMTINPDSPFTHDGRNIFLGDAIIGSASEVITDTCTDTYHRNNRRHVTVNSNIRGSCRGCKFCGTYEMASEESSLLSLDAMRASARQMIAHCGRVPESIGLVTACFPSEDELVDHLLMLRKVYRELGFVGEIQYIGSQLTSSESLDVLSSDGRFSLYFSVEIFDRRNILMRPEKARVTLDVGRAVIGEAKARGIDTSMLYILGLDPLETLEEEFPKYASILTRHPLVQLMQNYSPKHEFLKDEEAHSLDYYLRARKFMEGLFDPMGLYPRGWDNYRAPWFGWYGNKRLP